MTTTEGTRERTDEQKEMRDLSDSELIAASASLPMILRAVKLTTASVMVEELRRRVAMRSPELPNG